MKLERLLSLGLLAVSACASRSVPATYPAGAPASTHAGESRPADVTRALRVDPPYPDESAEGWSGLLAPTTNEPAAPAASDGVRVAPAAPTGHEHHGGHHHGAH